MKLLGNVLMKLAVQLLKRHSDWRRKKASWCLSCRLSSIPFSAGWQISSPRRTGRLAMRLGNEPPAECTPWMCALSGWQATCPQMLRWHGGVHHTVGMLHSWEVPTGRGLPSIQRQR